MSAASPRTDPHVRLDRRAWLLRAGVGAAAWVLRAWPSSLLAESRAGSCQPCEAPDPAKTPEQAWHVDDMWGHRYALPIPHASVAGEPTAWHRVEAVDRMLLI